MSTGGRSSLLVSFVCAALVGLLSADVAQAQCSRGGGGRRGGGSSSLYSPGLQQQLLQQQMLQQQILVLQQRQMLQVTRRSREMLDLVKQGPEAIRTALHDPDPERRTLAAITLTRYGPALTDDLIQLVTDDNGLVRQTARRSLVRLSTWVDGKPNTRRSVDFGPAPNANLAAQKAAALKWQAWLDRQQPKTNPTEIAAVR